MATASPVSLQTPPAPAPGTRAPASRWILNRPLDLLLFVATPLLIVPLAVAIQSPAIGADAEMFGLIVAAFGLGHHLPGLIRAYGDRELFQRFHWRFTLAPLFFVPVCIWLSYHRLNAMLLILLVWGCWHALMQVYGFARIYDGKVGSVSPVTARWDWLMCVCWFTGGQIFSSGKLARFLEYFYDSGGPLIPPAAVGAFRWAWLALCIAVTIGFLTNHVRRARGPAPHPNPVKLMMLASGIGFWWFAMVYVDQIVLGIALFEAFHDVQYLAIVWLFNCRRVNSTADLSSFMKFIFRRSGALLWLYVGLVFGYGMMSFAARSFETPGMRAALNGVILSSTILHFYYDGFIWKVRESSTRAALGLDPAVTSGNLRIRWGELGHLLKWSPLILVLGWLTVTELSGSTLPSQVEEPREWPHSTLVDRAQNIATAVPDDLRSQRRAAIGLANANRQVEAIDLLNGVLERHPDYIEGYEILAQIYSVDNGLVAAEKTYQRALQRTDRVEELTRLHQQLGEVHYLQHRVADAEREFQQALQLDPAYEPSLAALRQIKSRQRDP